MHIGFDVSQTGKGKTGCGFYAHALIEAMLQCAPEHHYSLYSSFGDLYFDPLIWTKSPYSGRNLNYTTRHFSLEMAKHFWQSPNLISLLNNPDIIQANNFWCPIQDLSSRVIYTCHDLNFTVDSRWSTAVNQINCFEGVFRSSIYADWIVAVSEATRAHYLRVFPYFPADRVRVIYPCSRFTEKMLVGERPQALTSIEGKFWLCVGTIEPRKNLNRLIKAYARYLALGGDAIPLILAGGHGWLMENFKAEIAKEGLADTVKMIGYVTDAELIWLYQHCYANLYPSLFEGFGLPILEGMQCGAPSLISSTTSMPEVGGDAAIQISPLDEEAWAQAMLKISQDQNYRMHLSQKSIEQSKRFNWQQSAKSLLALYEEAVALPKRQIKK